jgi:excisionase family DNA binding protein
VAPTDHIETPSGPDETVSHLVSAFERAIDTASSAALAQLLGSLERLRAIAWGRLLAVLVPSERPRTEPLEEMRHLTPIQVAELLSLKEAYVHELCRSRKIPATKQGKYWMIPVAELRGWLGRGHGIDRCRSDSLGLPDRPGTPAASGRSHDLPSVAPAGARRRRRAPIHTIRQQALSTDTNASRLEGPRSP